MPQHAGRVAAHLLTTHLLYIAAGTEPLDHDPANFCVPLLTYLACDHGFRALNDAPRQIDALPIPESGRRPLNRRTVFTMQPAGLRVQTRASEDKDFLFSNEMTEGAALECIDHRLKDLDQSARCARTH